VEDALFTAKDTTSILSLAAPAEEA
jgi:hypothetical protein